MKIVSAYYEYIVRGHVQEKKTIPNCCKHHIKMVYPVVAIFIIGIILLRAFLELHYSCEQHPQKLHHLCPEAGFEKIFLVAYTYPFFNLELH